MTRLPVGFLPVLALLTVAAAAQPIHFGVKGVIPLNDDIDHFFAKPESKAYAFGPMVTGRLPFGLSVEFEALYRRVGYSTSATDILGGFSTSRARGNSWEFPLLLRKSIGHGLYVAAGYAPRTIHGSVHSSVLSVVSLNPPATSFSQFDFRGEWETTHGLVLAGGVERRLGPLRIAPEIRYIRWNKPALDIAGSRGFEIRSTSNQADVMLGITF